MTVRRMSTTRKARIFEAAGGVCHICERRIHAGEPWDAEHVIPLEIGGDDSDGNLRPAHRACHAEKTRTDAGTIAKAKRVYAKHHNAKAPSRSPLPGGKASKWKRKIDGTVERR